MKKPNIYEYNDYRKFMKEFYNYQKARSSHSFSFRIFSERAGLGSPNYLQLVMEGKRNLSAKMIPRFSEAFKLESQQRAFFEILVKFTQAKTVSDKDMYFKELIRFREYRTAIQITHDQYQYFSHWYYVAIREMIALKNFQEDPKWIASTLTPPITEAQAREAMRLLLQMGLVVRDADGALHQSTSHLTTDETVSAISAYQFHHQMIQRGIEALNLPSDERAISAITLAIPTEELPALKKKIFQFLQDLQGWLETVEEKPNDVYQLNFQLFGLTNSNHRKEAS